MRRCRAATFLGLGLFGLLGCEGSSPTESSPAVLTVEFDEPVEAVFVEATGVFVAEFAVSLSRTGGGVLETLDMEVLDASQGTVLAMNRRPNADFAFPDSNLPATGALSVMAGIGFFPPPTGTSLMIRVAARLTSGETGTRQGVLVTRSP